jgi:hypothetical protein
MPVHTAMLVGQLLTKHSIATLPQPLSLLDPSPPDLFLFPKLKITFEGSFQTVENDHQRRNKLFEGDTINIL